MKFVGYLPLLVLCESLINVQAQSTKGREVKDGMQEGSTYVVSHLFDDCSPADTDRSSSSEPDLTYAELANHPKPLAKASLPVSFTICSMAVAPLCTPKDAMVQFFALLDDNGENFISAFLHGSRTSFRLNVRGNPYIPLGVLSSTVFPEQHVRSCLAVQTNTGSLQWVVDGVVVEDRIFEEIKQSVDIKSNLIGRILLGRSKWPSGSWAHVSNKVTALNIFSTALPLVEMQKMTSESSEECGKDGDFFAWDNMVWTLKGTSGLEYWRKDDICTRAQ